MSDLEEPVACGLHEPESHRHGVDRDEPGLLGGVAELGGHTSLTGAEGWYDPEGDTVRERKDLVRRVRLGETICQI